MNKENEENEENEEKELHGEMEAEPCVIGPDGEKTDASEHEYMLSNKKANWAADEFAVAQAIAMGMDEKEARAMLCE